MTILVICLVLLAAEVLEVMGWVWWILTILQILQLIRRLVSFQKQQNRHKPRQEIAIQTGNSSTIVERKTKQDRLEKDFMASSTSRKSTRDNAIAASVRDNIRLIEKDLIVSESSLLDELQIEGYLSEEEIKVMNSHSRKDQTHLFAEFISRLDNQAFLSVLCILKTSSFGHISDSLRSSYEKHLSVLSPVSLCATCRIKEEVDIKELRCDLLERDFIPSTLYSDINSCKKGKGHQKVLWDQLYFHLNKLMQKNNDVMRIFIAFFDTPRHRGLYYHLRNKNLSQLICFCNQNQMASRVEKDFIKFADADDTGEESNTQSLPVPIEPDWYRDAANSSSSDGVSAIGVKTVRKRQCSGDTPNRSGVSRKKLKHTGQMKSSWKTLSTKEKSEDTSSVDSNPKSDSTYKQTRKRRENTSPKKEISLTVSSNPSESETEFKSIGKKPRICLLSFMSDSDLNTDGELLKTYTFAKNTTYRKCDKNSPFSDDLKPTAFAKTKISNGESQIW